MDAPASFLEPRALKRQLAARDALFMPPRRCADVSGLGAAAHHLGGRNLWLDEAFSAWFSERSLHYLWTVLPTYEAHPPFYYSLLKVWRSGSLATAPPLCELSRSCSAR